MSKWRPEELEESYHVHKDREGRKEAAVQGHYHQGRVDATNKEPAEPLSKVRRLASAYYDGYADEVPSASTADRLSRKSSKLYKEAEKRLPKNYGQGHNMKHHGEGKEYGEK